MMLRKKLEGTFVIPKTPLKTLTSIQKNFTAEKSVDKNDFMLTEAEIN